MSDQPPTPGQPDPNQGGQFNPNQGGQPYSQQPYPQQGGQPNPQQPYPQQGGQPYSQQPYPQQGGGYYAPQQPPKKRKKWPWILLAIFIVLIAGMASCVALIGGVANEIDKDSKEVVQVTYEITGDGPGGTATYTTGELDTAQETNIQIPWSKQVEITGILKAVSLIASNDFDSEGSITCTIKRGDTVIVTNTSSGPGATASCSGDADTD